MHDRLEPSIPALLRTARWAYAHAVRRRLAELGYEDLPRNGPFLLGGMANRGVPLGSLIPQLGVSKQAASQLIDTLVIRGYLVRETDASDRRRMTVSVTDRGAAAAEAVRAAVAEVDDELARMISPSEQAGMLTGLGALCAMYERRAASERA